MQFLKQRKVSGIIKCELLCSNLSISLL